jgi:hypothetical protein
MCRHQFRFHRIQFHLDAPLEVRPIIIHIERGQNEGFHGCRPRLGNRRVRIRKREEQPKREAHTTIQHAPQKMSASAAWDQMNAHVKGSTGSARCQRAVMPARVPQTGGRANARKHRSPPWVATSVRPNCAAAGSHVNPILSHLPLYSVHHHGMICCDV